MKMVGFLQEYILEHHDITAEVTDYYMEDEKLVAEYTNLENGLQGIVVLDAWNVMFFLIELI
jgi:hypothetical protein